MSPRRFAVLILVLLAAAASAPAQYWERQVPRELDELQYLALVDARFVEDTPTGFVMEITNANEAQDLPNRRIAQSFWIASPPDARAQIEVREVDWMIQWGDESEKGLVLDTDSTAGTLPSIIQRPTVRYAEAYRNLGYSQGRFTLTTAVNSRDVPGRRGTAIVRRALLEVDLGAQAFRPAEGQSFDVAARDPYLLEMALLTAVNGVQAPRLARVGREPEALGPITAWGERLARAEANGPVLLFEPWREGLYSLDARDLAQTTGRLSEIDPSRLRAFIGGAEVPILVEGGALGHFGPDTKVLVYVPPRLRHHHAFVPVWLMVDDAPDGPEPARFRAEPIDPQLEAAEEFRITAKQFLFEPVYYRHISPTARTGRWTVHRVNRDAVDELRFDARGVAASGGAEILVSMAIDRPQDAFNFEVFINGHEVGARTGLSGRGPFDLTLQFPAEHLREQDNIVGFHYPDGRDPRLAGHYYVNFAEVTYPLDPERIPANTRFTLSGGSPARIPATIVRPGLTRGEYGLLVDATTPTAPRLAARMRANHHEAHSSFPVVLERTAASRTFYFSDPAAASFLPPGREVSVEPLANPADGADYVVLAPRDLLYEAGELARYRTGPGRRAKAIAIEDVNAVFGFGHHGSESIERFAEHAFWRWPGRRISQLVLVGEASDYWWPMEFPRDDVSPNQMPIFRGYDPNQTVRGDNGFGIVTGRGDLQDIDTGRIPASTPEELAGYIARLRDYEQNPPEGPWRSRHLFVTDDEPEFARVAERIIGTELRGVHKPRRLYLQDFPYEDYFRIFLRKRSSEMTRAIVDALSEGALTVTYLGHGGPNIWSSERIFHYRDLPMVDSGGRRPIMAAASCDTAWIDYPVDPVRQSLGEQFVLSERGGGIAVFAPVAGTSSFEHDFLIRPFYDAIQRPEFPHLGAVTTYAKMMYLLERNQGFVSEQFVLLGDPALRIPQPTGRMNLQASPATLFAAQSATIAVDGETPGLDWGTAEMSLLDPHGEVVAGPARFPVREGRFEARLDTPPFLRPEPHRVLVKAWNSPHGGFETQSFMLPVLEPEVELSWVSDPPITAEIVEGQPVQVQLSAANLSESFLSSLLLRLTDAGTGQELTSAPIELQPGVMRRWGFQTEAVEGVTVLRAEVHYANARPHQLPVASADLEIRALGASGNAVHVSAGLVDVERVASPEQTIFEVPVFNVRREGLQEMRARLFLLDRPEGTPVGTELRGEAIPQRGKAVLRFRADTLFPEGMLPFRLDVEGVTASREAFRESMALQIEVPRGADLLVVPGSVHAERNDYVEGQTVFVRARVRNAGPEAARQVRTTLYVDFPWSPDAVAPSLVRQSEIIFEKPLLPGEEREVRLRWDPTPGSPLDARLYVVVNSDRRTPEVDLRNNVGDVLVNRLRLPNLAWDFANARLSREVAAIGDEIEITAPYINNSPFDFAHPFIIEIRAQGVGVPDALVYRGTFDGLEAGETAVVQATWRADGVRDRFLLSLNEDREFGEMTPADNTHFLQFDYTVPLASVEQTPTGWSFDPASGFGDYLDSRPSPLGGITIASFPRQGRRIAFSNDFVVGDPLPLRTRRSIADNRISLTDDGSLEWSAFELPQPVSFRIPMDPDDGTTLYDIYFYQLGPQHRGAKPINHYRYRIEGAREWTENENRAESRPFIGRIETGDNFLDLEIGPSVVPSRNLIIHVDARPVRGVYLSPIHEMRGWPAGRFAPDAMVPDGARVEVEYRLGSGSRTDIQFGPWQSAGPGEEVAADPGARFVQWRAVLIGSLEGYPILRRLDYEVAARSPVAQAQ